MLLGLRVGLNVIILRGGGGGVVVDVVDVMSTTLALFELEGRGEDSEDADDGRGEESLLYKESEGLPGGEELGDKRKLRMGRDSKGLDREGGS